MRRVSDDLLKAVVFLYPTREAAVNGEGYGGSGFLVGMTNSNEFDPASPAPDDLAHVYVVTNAHVAARCAFLRTSHDLQPIIRINWWTNHPNGDDVAVAHLGILGVDTIALGKIVHRSMFVTQQLFDDNHLGPGDQLFMTGRFTGLDERERNAATVRAGTLAMATPMPVKNEDWGGVLQESFLAEVNSKAGYSGSPVYVEVPFEVPAPYPVVGYPPRPAYMGLLGITWGIWRSTVPVLDPETREPVAGRWVLHENSGIELVVPAWRIMELLTSDEVLEHRRRAEAARQGTYLAFKPDATGTDAIPLPTDALVDDQVPPNP